MERVSLELFLPVVVLVPEVVRVWLLQELVQELEQELKRELERQQAVAFPQPGLVSVHSNAERRTHLFFFSKKVPCGVDYKHKFADYTDDTDNESLTGVICGFGTGFAGFFSLTCPGLI
jgi:hypothetical protein